MRGASLIVALAASWCAASSVPPPPKPAPELAGAEVELKTQDGWTLKAKHLAGNQDLQTFILLHGRGQRKETWIRLARALASAGYGYLGVDLRGHGRSAVGPDGQSAPWRKFKVTKDAGFVEMTNDVQAAVAWLTSQGVLEETIGLAGADVGGSIALQYAALHPRVPMVVMLSPGLKYQEVLTVNAMRRYIDRPILLVYSEKDKTSSKEAPILYEFARRSAGERNTTVLSVPDRPSPRLLNSEMSARIVAWIASPVKPDPAALSTSTAVSPKGPPPAEENDGLPEVIQ